MSDTDDPKTLQWVRSKVTGRYLTKCVRYYIDFEEDEQSERCATAWLIEGNRKSVVARYYDIETEEQAAIGVKALKEVCKVDAKYGGFIGGPDWYELDKGDKGTE